MRLFFIVVFVLLFQPAGFAQVQTSFDFYPLEKFDTVKDSKIIQQIKDRDNVTNTNFFFARKYAKNQGLFLFEKKGDVWLVYNWDTQFISNYSVNKHQTFTKRYVSINISAMRSGSGENYYGWFVLFDLKKKSMVILDVYSHNSDSSDDGERYVNTRECGSKVKFEKSGFRISRKCNKNALKENSYCDNCIPSGFYELNEKGLIKRRE